MENIYQEVKKPQNPQILYSGKKQNSKKQNSTRCKEWPEYFYQRITKFCCNRCKWFAKYTKSLHLLLKSRWFSKITSWLSRGRLSSGVFFLCSSFTGIKGLKNFGGWGENALKGLAIKAWEFSATTPR